MITLIDRGDIFDAGPDATYFVLMRACKQGADCKRLLTRIASLEDVIGQERARQNRELAYRGGLEKIKLNDLLLGKTF